jgi:hypothetical protein
MHATRWYCTHCLDERMKSDSKIVHHSSLPPHSFPSPTMDVGYRQRAPKPEWSGTLISRPRTIRHRTDFPWRLHGAKGTW